MKKKFLNLLLLFSFVLPITIYADNRLINGNDYNIYKKTKEEITAKWQIGVLNIPSNYDEIYEELPSYNAPYKAGVVKQSYLNDVIDNLNYYRYIIGVPEVKVYPVNDPELQTAEVVQNASLRANNYLTHYIYNVFERPEDMPEEFYHTGAYANHNIVAYGEPTEPNFFFFDESVYDESNPTAGHRMALLGPEMSQIEYGIGSNADYKEKFGVVYGRIHHNLSNYDEMENDFAAYPAPGNFPKQDFANISDWDVFLNVYKFKFLDESEEKNVKVTLKNLSTGETESRSIDEGNLQFDYYCENNACAAYYRLHIAQPTKLTAYYEDNYEVYIENLIDENGELVDIKYTVNFYDKFENIDSPITGIVYDLNLYRIYIDGEYRESLIQQFLKDSTAHVVLESGSVIYTDIDSFNATYVGKQGDNSIGYKYSPVITKLPSWANDSNNVLANSYLGVFNYSNEADYRFDYVDTSYKKNVGNAVTIYVSEFNPQYAGETIYMWFHEVDGELTPIEIDESNKKYRSDGLNLTVSNLTKEDAGTYYLVALLNPTSYYGTRLYISKPFTVTINNPATGISVEKPTANLHVGDTYNMNAKMKPVDAEDTITYLSSDETIATVDEAGTVTALKEGTVTITAKVGTYSAKTEITITKVKYLKGDLNQNNKIDLPDIICLLKRYLGIESTTSTDLEIGDMDDDGNIGLKDVILLLRTYLGIN